MVPILSEFHTTVETPTVELVKLLSTARDLGQREITKVLGDAREGAMDRVRQSMGLTGVPPDPCLDPNEAYLPVDGAARVIHADLASMLIGGLASLLLQMLHPAAMTGVAEHSRYRDDPLGRLAQTATFVGTTTYGSRSDAEALIQRVAAVHGGVRGFLPDGTSYRASDPHLLRWVHVVEVSMFLAGVRAFGPQPISSELADAYVAEMSVIAIGLGLPDPPINEGELRQQLEDFRCELSLIPAGRDARNFVLRGVSQRPLERAAYTSLVAAAVGILPTWAQRQLEIPVLPLANVVVVRPVAATVAAGLRFVVPPAVSRSRRQR